jgi:Protein of unknown function (DUF2397)
MATEPAPSRHDAALGEAPPPPSLAEASPEAPHPAGRVRAFAYLDTESTHRYRQLMGVLLANKRRFGLRMAPAQIATRLWDRYSARYDSPEVLERDLGALSVWGAVDRIQDSSRASSTAEFKRKRFTYDITAAGEIAERAALRVDGLSERIGALERSQLPELLDALIALGGPGRAPRSASWQARCAVQRRRRQARADANRHRRLHARAGSDDGRRTGGRARAVRALQAPRDRPPPGFPCRAAPTRFSVQHRDRTGRGGGHRRIVAIAAESDEPPVWGLTDDEVAARRAEQLAGEWNGVRRWFRGGAGEAPPWHDLDHALGDAIEWIIQSAQRLIDRRTQRVDRAAEYRSLALLFDRGETVEGCHALYATVFGLLGPRHFE